MSIVAETVPAATGYLSVLRRRLLYVAVLVPAGVLGATYLAFSIPPLYRSSATILLELSSVNKDVVASTVINYSSQQIEIIEGRVLTLATLEQLVREYDPYPRDRQLSIEKKAQRIVANTSIERVDPVTFKPQEESNAFSLHYDNPDPQRAAGIASRLAQLFLTYNQRNRTQAAQDAEGLLAGEAAGVSKQLREMDDEVKQFKARHNDALPDDTPHDQSEIDRAEHDLDTLEQEILRAEEKESLLTVQLNQLSPNLVAQTGDLTDLATVRARLAEAEQRYTPEHPEVIRLKKALETLAAQRAVAHNGIVGGANNPQYLTTASELEAARHELAGLRGEADRLRRRIDNYEKALRLAPAAEREYSEILRRRASLQAAYDQIQEKLRNAQLAERFESKEQGERFTLLRAPLAAHWPVYPNRVGLIMVGILVGFALAGIAVGVAETADATLRGTTDIPQSADAPLLASIPAIPIRIDMVRARVALAAWLAAGGIALAAVGMRVLTALHGPLS